MNILSKIILILISIWIFVFLIFVTYITNSFSNLEKINYINTKIGLFEINKIAEQDIEKILVQQLNISDKVIFNTWSIETKDYSWSTIIIVTPWIYLFDLREINSNYIIKWEWFEINNKWPWTFFINNLNSRKNIIFSVNTLTNLNLKHYKTNEDITSIDLYPHTYLIFNPQKNIFVKNSDLLKIFQTFTLWYFNEQIINKDEMSETFLDLISLKNEDYKKWINNSILLIKQEYIEETKNINSFIKASIGTIPGENFINKYSSLFINPNKKSIYYKNIIIKNLHDLIKENNLNKNAVQLIVTNINLLEEIDKQWAKEIKDVITYYYWSVIKSNKELNTILNFSELISKINNKNFNFNFNSLIYLEKIFFKYDYLENTSFYNEISNFWQDYFDDLNIDIKWTDNSKLSINDMGKVDSMLFFLENILLTSDFASLNLDTKDLIIIFNNYIDIANSFYSYSDEKIKRTWLFTNSKILNKFVNILEEKYFLKERNENSLLIINDETIINKNDILLLEENINKIFNFYNDYKRELKEENNKDKFVIKLYSNLNEKYKEYFAALKNYPEYLVKYDKSKKDLLYINTINESDNILVLSLNHAKDYLQAFNWVQINNSTIITLMDYNYCLNPSIENEKWPVEVPYCYKIDNLNIDYNNASFLLHPFEKNKIDEIYVENEIKVWSYKLDDIEVGLFEKMKTGTKDKDKYNFKNFLIDTFWQKSIPNSNKQIAVNTIENELVEDPVIKIFKRNKLFWETWDFVDLVWFIDINYKDLIVEKIGEEYSININHWIFNLVSWKNNTFYWEFKSEYNFSPNHSFINPEIKLIDKKNKNNLLLWNSIYIIWQYKVNTIEEELKDFFENYDSINYIINTTSQDLRETNIKITYIKSSNKINFEIPYKWKMIYITLLNWNITEAKYNNDDKLKSITPYINLSTILNNINN